MRNPQQILTQSLQRATTNIDRPLIDDQHIVEQIVYVVRNIKNKSGIRFLMACLLAKLHKPTIDIRKPYTQIGDPDAFSGRTYDEQYLSLFINEHNLPCNKTTAFLTPALRNHNQPLVKGLKLEGEPPKLYAIILDLLDAVYHVRISAQDLLDELLRWLLIVRDEQAQRISSLMAGLETTKDALPLSSDDIVRLIKQHLVLKGTSRLPVLLIVAAYNAIEKYLGERVVTLQSHNAADKQTGSLGDVEIVLAHDNRLVTCYEMKDKVVTITDIDLALQKVISNSYQINNYIFVTTELIQEHVQEYANSLYKKTRGTEFVILNCIDFIHHFLHLFHRVRVDFLEEYQNLILREPESAVSQPVKEAFLVMRQAAETDY